jgi:aminopeptidase-like protein
MYFLQFHNPNLYLLTDRYPIDQIIIIDNQEYYLGSLPRRISGEYIVYNIKTKRLRFGNPLKSNKIKELKFDDDDEICEVFVGSI